MANLITKVKEYLSANNITNVDFQSEVVLEQDYTGDFIKTWNLDIPQPTVEQLDSYENAANAQEQLTSILANRASAYPSIQEQLDMQYWDSVNGTTTWADAIAKVKADYPKGAE
jgi:hypothetical protein